MKRASKLGVAGVAAAIALVPAIGYAKGPPPNAPLPAKAKAYGRYCQDQSKKHVAGQKGTPFSQCVTAMAKLAHGSTNNPRTACKNLSKKHTAGQHGTPFSQCVSAGAKLLRQSAHNT